MTTDSVHGSMRESGTSQSAPDTDDAARPWSHAGISPHEVLDHIADAVFVIDREQRFIEVNERACTSTGYTRDELLTMRVSDIDVGVSSADVAAILDSFSANGPGQQHDVTGIHRRKDGTTFPVEVRIRAIPRGDSLVTVAIARDVSDRVALESSHQRDRDLLEAIISTTVAAITTVDKDGRIVYANDAAKQVLGISESQIVKRQFDSPDWKITALDGGPFPHDELPFARVMATGESVHGIRHAIVGPDGERKALSVNGAPMHDESGELTGAVFSVTDITAQLRAEEDRDVIVASTNSVIGGDYFDELVAQLGRLFRRRFVLVAELDRAQQTAHTLAFFADGKPADNFTYDVRGTPCEMVVAGQQCHVATDVAARFPADQWLGDMSCDSYFGVPLCDASGHVVGHLAILDDKRMDDVSRESHVMRTLAGRAGIEIARQRAERALRDSEHRFRITFDAAPVSMIVADMQGRIAMSNKMATQVFGYTAEELRDRTIESLVPGELRDSHLAALRQYADHPRSRTIGDTFDVDALRADGTRIPVEVGLTPITIGDEQYALGVVVDLTDRHRAAALQTIQLNVLNAIAVGVPLDTVLAILTSLIERQAEHAGCSIFIADDGGVCRCIAAGSTPVVAPGMIGRMPTGGIDAVTAAAKGSGGDVEEIVTTDGEPIGCVVLYRPHADHPGATDRTFMELASRLASIAVHHYRAIEAIHDRERRLDMATRAAALGTWDLRLETGSMVVNERWAEMLGDRHADIEPMLASWERRLHPDDADTVHAAFEAHITGKSPYFEAEYRLRKRDGDWLWVRDRGQVVERDAQGKAVRVAGAQLDITDERHAEAERQRLESELRQAQKLEAVGTLAAGMAHEFNNLLAAIRGAADLAQATANPTGDLRRFIDVILEASDRGIGVTRSLLTYAKPPTQLQGPISVASIINDAGRMIERLLPDTIALTLDADDRGIHVLGTPDELHQVLVNLAINARDAMTEGGSLTIALASATDDQGRNIARVTVTDTGHGMTPETRDRMFEPFFTTKARGQGTGLGMSIVHGIVAQHNGRIHVNSSPDQGTCVSVDLLCASPDAAPPGASYATTDRHANPRASQHTALFAEDDELVRGVMQGVIRKHADNLLIATDGNEAMRLLDEHAGDIDIALLDLDLPGRSGLEIRKAIRQRSAHLPVILMTGWVDAEVDRIDDPHTVVLTKPFSIIELRDTMSAMLADRGA